MVTIVKRFEFEAAHRLENHDGACARLHGHSYKVDVAVSGPIITAHGAPNEGMVMDFGRIKAAYMERVHAVCDHGDLNVALPVPVTTAEHIATWILGEMRDALDTGRAVCNPPVEPYVAYVRVWETRTSYVEVS